MSGWKSCSARRKALSVSTRLDSQLSSARWSSRIASSASSARSSTTSTRREWVAIELLGRVVEQEPVQPDVGDGAGEGLEIHGFHDVAVRAQLVGALDVRLLARGRQHDDGNRFRPGVAFEAAQDFEPVHLRQLEIE